MEIHWDPFFSQLCKNQINLIWTQEKYNKERGGTNDYANLSLKDTIVQLIKESKFAEAKLIAKNAKMNEVVFRAIEAWAMVEIKKPQEVLNYLKEKNPKLPFKYIAEIFIEFDERQYALEAVQKIKNVDD